MFHQNFTILPTITVDQAGYDSNIEMPQFGNKDKLEMSDITLLPAINSSKTNAALNGNSKFFFATFYSNRPTVCLLNECNNALSANTWRRPGMSPFT